MKINITKKQYKMLVELVYLGEWTVNSWRVGNDRIEAYSDLQEYLYSFAKDFGMDDVIVYDQQFAKHYPTREFEESMDKYIDSNDNDVFWKEFVSRLARKELEKSNEDFESREEYVKRLFEIEAKYEEEFEKNGLENVEVKGL